MSDHHALFDTIEKAFNAGDADAFAACFAADAVQHHPFFGEPCRGREAILAAERTMFDAFDDITFRWEQLLSDSSTCAGRFVVRATNTGPLAMPDGSKIPATNRTVEVDGAAFFTTDADGLIVEAHRHEDPMDFMRQLGLMG